MARRRDRRARNNDDGGDGDRHARAVQSYGNLHARFLIAAVNEIDGDEATMAKRVVTPMAIGYARGDREASTQAV